MLGENRERYSVTKGRYNRRYTGLLVVGCFLALIGVYGISIATSALGQISALSINPDPIKLGNNASISYSLDQAGFVSIDVYKENGVHVKNLLNNMSRAAGTYYQNWDGKDKNGVLVSDGNYKFVVEAKNSAGTVIGQAEKTQLAAGVPTVTANDTPDPFNPVNGEGAAINYTVSREALITVSILKGYTPIRTITANEPKTTGTYTVRWDGKDDSGNMAGDGIYNYQIDAVNPLVAAFKGTTKSTTTVETGPPQLTGFTAGVNPFKIGSSTYISFNLSENAAVTLKILDSAGNTVKTILNGLNRNAGFNSLTWNGTNDAGTNAAEGTYTAAVSAVDTFGKSSGEQRLTITAGNQPVVTNVALNPNPYNPADTANGTAKISYSISCDSLVTVEIIKGYMPVRTLISNGRQTGGLNTVTWDGKDDAGNIAGDGSYTCRITAVSPVADLFKSTVSTAFTVETGPPSISDMSLGPNPFKLGGTSLSIRYNLSENANITIGIFRGTELVRNLVTNQAKNAGFLSATWDGKDNAGNNVVGGIYTVVVKATDASGKSGEARADVTAGYLPEISNAAVVPQLFNPAEGNANIKFDLSSNAILSVTILNGYTPVRTLVAANLTPAGSHSIIWDGKDDTNLPVPDGPYTYQIEAVSPTVDTFRSIVKGNLSVEGANPSVTDLSLASNIVKIGVNTLIRYSLSEPATVNIRIINTQGQTVKDFTPETKTKGGIYSLPWDTRDNLGNPIVSGDYVVEVVATDNANKHGSAQYAFQAGAIPTISVAAAVPETIDASLSQQTTISYYVYERSYVTIKITDESNGLWRTFYSSKEVIGADSVTWDGSDDRGQFKDGSFKFSIQATSVIGSFKGTDVTGVVEVKHTSVPRIPSEPKCIDCHRGYPSAHPVSNCMGCHGGDKPVQNCANCHEGWHAHSDGNMLGTYECTYCHNGTYSYKIPVHPQDMDGYHSSGVSVNCLSCHKDALTTEHLDNPVTQTDPVLGSTNPWTCDTCHTSAVTKVQQAVANKQKNCNACHDQSSHDALHNTNFLDRNCTSCHKNNLTEEHLNNPKTQTDPVKGQVKPWTCDTCHKSSKPEVIAAFADKNMDCVACHLQAHGITFAISGPTNIPLYNGFSWTEPLNAGLWAGESWIPAEFLASGKVIISNRRNDVVGDAVYQYYATEMPVRGWTPVETVREAADCFRLTFAKGTGKAVVWFYGGENHDTSPVSPGGYRIEVMYK